MLKNLELTVTYTVLGTLYDFGLGRSDGIESSLSTLEDVERFANSLTKCTSQVTDLTHYACIDGRSTLCATGTDEAPVRSRVAGASVTIETSAVLGDAAIIDTLPDDAEIPVIIELIDDHVEDILGISPCSHEGGCGCAIKQKEIVGSIGTTGNAAAVEAVINTPAILRATGLSFDAGIHAKVQANTVTYGNVLKQKGWDGMAYSAGVTKRHAQGVEALVVADDAFGGHKEQVVALVLDNTGTNQTISKAEQAKHGVEDVFVVNLNTLVDISHGLGKPKGPNGIKQVYQAAVAEQIGTADVLCSKNMPIILIVIDKPSDD